MKFVADFETTTDELDCRVWACAWVNIDSVNLPNYGNTLQITNTLKSFLDYFKKLEGVHDCYFHNLKFDGSFIIDYLLRNGYTYDDFLTEPNTFNTMITDQKIFYAIKVRFNDRPQMNKNGKPKMRKGEPVYKKCIIHFKDSLKKIPLKVSQIAKSYGIKEQKTEIDYKAYRPVGYELTDKEKEYITNDVIIVAKALDDMINKQEQTCLTISSDALSDFKHRLANVPRGTSQNKQKAEECFREFFPELTLEADNFIRKAYKGGYTYCNPKYASQVVGKGLVYDVNSLYPSRMRDCELPYGVPVYFTGIPEYREDYPLFITHFKCTFKIKPNHLPTIQLKNNSRFMETEYLTEIDSVEELYLTNVDLKLFEEHYDVFNLEFIDGFYFQSKVGFFEDYIEHWGNIKKSTKDKGKRQLAKLMLNSLYGKFASSTSGTMKEPFLNDEEEVKYESVNKDGRPPVYTALACFTTAWARDLMIRSAQECYDRFLYCDTDSLHVLGLELPDINIHESELGFWKCEGVFSQAKYLRAKTYLETFCQIDGKNITSPQEYNQSNQYEMEVKCCGMPDNTKQLVDYDNFNLGQCYNNNMREIGDTNNYAKLMPKTVKGGVVLVDRDFHIKF